MLYYNTITIDESAQPITGIPASSSSVMPKATARDWSDLGMSSGRTSLQSRNSCPFYVATNRKIC